MTSWKGTSKEERIKILKSLSKECYDRVLTEQEKMVGKAPITGKYARADIILLATVANVARIQGVSLTEAVEKVNQDPDAHLPRLNKAPMDVYDAYTTVMEDIKRRTDVVYGLLDQKTNDVMYPPVRIESSALQVRMILELITLASLSLNKAAFEENRRKFENHWQPKKILSDLKKLDPDFYPLPKPIYEVPSRDKRARDEIHAKTGFMGCKELIEIHGKCGDILHAKNPFKENVDYGHYENELRNWMKQIIELLNYHEIRLFGSDNVYVVHMMGEEDSRVHMYEYEFAPV